MNFKKIFYFLIVIVFLCFLVFLFFNEKEKNISQIKQEESIKYVKIGEKTIKVEVADTAELQEKGLSGRKYLGEDEGMLFVFKNYDKYPFWMKNMNFAIDIIWLAPQEAGLDQNLKVVDIKKDALLESYPESFFPSENAKYVLEVPAGFSEKNNLKVGDSASFLTF